MLTTVTAETMPNFMSEKRRGSMRKIISNVYGAMSAINAAVYTLLVIYQIETLTASVSRLILTCIMLAFPFGLLQLSFVAIKSLSLVIVSRKRRI